jgi:hypothetical protein
MKNKYFKPGMDPARRAFLSTPYNMSSVNVCQKQSMGGLSQ